MVKRIGNKQYPLHRCFGLLNLDLNAEDSDHEGEGSAIDDQAEAADHEPGEDEADDVVLPLGRQPAQRLLQYLQIYLDFPALLTLSLNAICTLAPNKQLLLSDSPPQNQTATTVLSHLRWFVLSDALGNLLSNHGPILGLAVHHLLLYLDLLLLRGVGVHVAQLPPGGVPLQVPPPQLPLPFLHRLVHPSLEMVDSVVCVDNCVK